MVLVDGAGTPLAASLDAASPVEVALLEQTLASQPIRGKPARLIADRGYDSNAVCHSSNAAAFSPSFLPARPNTESADQDGRCLRRYRRRWIVERTIGWLGDFPAADRAMTVYSRPWTGLK